jgi:ribosomal protein S18 acetylase RimI-like enzyme
MRKDCKDVLVMKKKASEIHIPLVAEIRAMSAEDVSQASEVHAQAFTRQTLSYDWLQCTLNAFPRMLCYVATRRESVAGYIVWSQKSGFRPEAVVELEQIAVLPSLQGRGIGTLLTEQSLQQVREHLYQRGSTLKHVIVTTRADNYAQSLYKQVLGAEVEARITNLYSADEVIMIVRNV